MNSRRPVLTPLLLGILGFTGAVSPLATDMYLASFGSIQSDLVTTASMVQLTLTMFFLGNACGQLIIGPLSDTFGRRRPLLISLSIYTVVGIALVFAPTIELFIWMRLMLGFFGSAGIVLARAIAVDLSQGETAVKALSVIAMVGGLGPLLAPPIGGITHDLWGWRGTLATMAALSVLVLVLSWIFIPESLPPARRRSGNIFASYAPILGLILAPRYRFFMLAFVLGFTAMFGYIAASPFVGQNVLGMSPLMYAFAFSASGTALIASNLINARIAARVGPQRMLRFGIALLAVSSIAMLTLSLTGALTVWSFIVCAFVLTGGAGFSMSNASALALAEAPHARGVGAALMGATQFAVSGLSAPIVGAWGEHTAVPMGVVVCVAALATALMAALGSRAPRRETH